MKEIELVHIDYDQTNFTMMFSGGSKALFDRVGDEFVNAGVCCDAVSGDCSLMLVEWDSIFMSEQEIREMLREFLAEENYELNEAENL